MGRVTAKNTKPEILVRRMLFRLGYRYRLHVASLPGRPDIAFSRKRKVILVHGCFWHQHPGCPKARAPSSRLDYWLPKLARNRERDEATMAALADSGWTVEVVWQCEMRDEAQLSARLSNFLGAPPHPQRGTANTALPPQPTLVVG